MMPTLNTRLKDDAVLARDIPVGHLAKDEDGNLVIRTSNGLVFLPSFTHFRLASSCVKYIDCGKIEIE
jgi:hypothetical protein